MNDKSNRSTNEKEYNDSETNVKNRIAQNKCVNMIANATTAA
jgi:hypothetical protein